MKRQLCLNRKLQEFDLFEQNKYLGNKINSMKPSVKSFSPEKHNKNILIKTESKKQSTYIILIYILTYLNI